jgi:hypothetical protein
MGVTGGWQPLRRWARVAAILMLPALSPAQAEGNSQGPVLVAPHGADCIVLWWTVTTRADGSSLVGAALAYQLYAGPTPDSVQAAPELWGCFRRREHQSRCRWRHPARTGITTS